MIGVLIVSHSHKIAEGIKELAMQMAKDDQKIIAVGGTNCGTIGTDPIAIYEGMLKADSGDGVLVLADIGSSIMSVDLAKEMLDEEIRNRVYLANAPIVEGSVSAVVEIGLGSSIYEILLACEKTKQMDKIL